PGDAVAAGDADQAEEHDDDDLGGLEVPQPPEVDDHDGADEGLQDEDELALRHEIGLAGLEDELRDLPHRAVDGQVLQLHVGRQAEEHLQQADEEAAHQELAAGQTQEGDGAQVGQDELRLAGRGGRGGEEGGGGRGQPQEPLLQGRTVTVNAWMCGHGFLQSERYAERKRAYEPAESAAHLITDGAPYGSLRRGGACPRPGGDKPLPYTNKAVSKQVRTRRCRRR